MEALQARGVGLAMAAAQLLVAATSFVTAVKASSFFGKGRGLLFATALSVLPASHAQEVAFPSKPVKIVVGFAAGGLTDQFARNLAQVLTKQWGQQVIVENRAGGNLVPAIQYFVSQPADGYTLHLGNSQPYSVNVAYLKSLPYGQNDYTAVAVVSEIPFGIYVPAASPFKTIGELVAYARSNPGKLNYASPGQLSPASLAMEAFKSSANIDIQQVAFQGGAPAIVALLGSQVEMMIADLATAMPHYKAGKVRILVTNQDKRLASLPDVPSFTEAGFNADLPPGWYGVFAPPKTPASVVDRLNTDINKAMRAPEVIRFLDDSTMVPFSGTPQTMDALVKSDYRFIMPLMQRLGLKQE